MLLNGTPSSLPLEGFAVLNDRPVACQIRGPTDPQGDRWHGEAVTDEVSPRPGASVSFVSDGPISSNSGRNGGKNAGRNCVSALPQRAMPVHCRPRFPSRNRRFPDRCRSPDCASTAFRCRCLLLRQKLFVLPCRRLKNNYILCPTGTPTFAALRRQRRDLIIATRPAHQPLPSLLLAAAAQEVQAIPRTDNVPHRTSCASAYRQICMTHSAPRGP